jgi:predicted nucleic acid-binding protein
MHHFVLLISCSDTVISEGDWMGLWRNFKLRGALNVNIHALLIGHKDLAKLIVKSKSTWVTSALASIKRGERVGDVAALVVIEQIRRGILCADGGADLLKQDFYTANSISDLKVANQAIVSMIGIANTLKNSGNDYSPSIDYIIAQTHAQLLTPNPGEQNYITRQLLAYGDIVKNDLKHAVRSARNATPPPPPDPLSIESKYLDIFRGKVSGFVETRYRNRTSQLLVIYKQRLDRIDDDAADAENLVGAETDLLRHEIVDLNEWAWNEVRAMTDGDVNHVDNLFTAKEVVEKQLGEKLADIIEFTVEGHTKELIKQVASLRQEKLDRIAVQRRS